MVYQKILERVSKTFQKMMKGFSTDSERVLRRVSEKLQRILNGFTKEVLKDSRRVSKAFQKMMKAFPTDSEKDFQRSLRGAPRDPQRIHKGMFKGFFKDYQGTPQILSKKILQ